MADLPRPVRVLELLVSTAVGGGPKHVFDLVTRLSPELSPIVAAPPDGPFFERFRKAGIETHALALDRLSPWTLAQMLRVAREREVGLIHSHGKGAGLYGRLAGRLLGIPAIHTFHGLHYQDYSPTGRCLYLGLELDNLVVGSVARFDPVKGLEVLLEAVRRLQARLPRLRLVLVGDGPEMPRLSRLAGDLGLGSAVTFAGVVEDAARPGGPRAGRRGLLRGPHGPAHRRPVP